jgi:hypothetical protein
VLLLCFFFISLLLTCSELFSYPYSYPFHFPSFSCTTICCSPFQLLFLPLSIHSFSHLHLPLLSSPTCQHITPPSYLTTCWIAYCTNCTQLQSSAIPDTSTPYLEQWNTPKHTQGPQNPVAPIPLHPPTHPFFHPHSFSATFINSQKYITSLITILPPHTPTI